MIYNDMYHQYPQSIHKYQNIEKTATAFLIF
jgi:hypothetical protein